MRVVFLHGAGRSGGAAWPVQIATGDARWVFLDRVGEADDPHADAERILDGVEDAGHVVAHSYGAMAAILAANMAPRAVCTLLLCEPACVGVARGSPRVEEHVASLTPVFAVADEPTVSDDDFARRFSEAVGAPPSEVPLDTLRTQGRRLRRTTQPWQVAVPAPIVSSVPTLVVTGGRGDMYDEIATALTDHGAEHLVVPGFGHRPQDDPRAIDWMTDFWAAHDRS